MWTGPFYPIISRKLPKASPGDQEKGIGLYHVSDMSAAQKLKLEEETSRLEAAYEAVKNIKPPKDD